jgi:hypothetical protein
MPKAVWETVPANDTDAQGEFVKTGNLTCSGPYLIDSYKKGEWWLLRRNPYFFRTLPDATWTFSVTGLQDYDNTETVLTVDEIEYKITNLAPLNLSFINGTSHTYAFTSSLATTTKYYNWQNCSGDKTQLYGSIIANTNGSVTANYTSQIIPEYATPIFLAIALFATLSIAMFKKKTKTSRASQ